MRSNKLCGRPLVHSQSSALVAMVCALLVPIGCGGTKTTDPGTGPIAGEDTTVALQFSSDANGQFIAFDMGIQSLTLTNATGKTVTILNNFVDKDFIPVNGGAAPLAVVSVPQDVYTSASAVVSYPLFEDTFVDSSGSLNFAGYQNSPNSIVPPVVNLAAPLTVEGSTMGLTIDLLASKSGTLTGLPFPNMYTITPVFNLTPFALTAPASTPQNGKNLGLRGRLTAVDGGAFTMAFAGAAIQAQPGQTVSAAIGSSTVFQGVSSAAGLAVGNFVDVDLALQPDTTYVATRVEVQDAAAKDEQAGLLAEVDPSFNFIAVAGTQQQGDDLSAQPVGLGYYYVYGDSTIFQTSARFPNLTDLPFTATFNAATLAAGQRVSVGSTSILVTSPGYQMPTSITLIPQTVDGVVTAVGSSGGYTVYTVTLASYDPIPQLNSPQGAAVNTRLPHAEVLSVYVNDKTSILGGAAPTVGGTFRFDGLLFNDATALRMVCDQIQDGVPQ